MKLEHRREATEAGRHNLARSLQGLQHATALLAEAAESGDKSTYLSAGALWDKAVAQAQADKTLSEKLLGEEVQTWIEKS